MARLSYPTSEIVYEFSSLSPILMVSFNQLVGMGGQALPWKAGSMLKPGDLVSLPCKPELVQAGIVYACRSLAYTYDRMGGSSYERLRRIIAGKTVEGAFRLLLHQEEVPHNRLGETPFTDPDYYDVGLGGRRCDIKSFTLFQTHLIRHVHRDPACLLDAAALVPADQAVSSRLNEDDLYVFAFLTALTASHSEDLAAVERRGQPFCFTHILSERWLQNWPGQPLGKPLLTSQSPGILTLEIGGQAESGEFLTETLYLSPSRRAQARHVYANLAYIYTSRPPQGAVTLHSPSRQQTENILPGQWENIWVYGMDLILAGYIPRGEFLRHARLLPTGSRVLQYNHTRTSNLFLPLVEIYPLYKLFKSARMWQTLY